MELEEFKQSKIQCDNRVRELEEQLSVLQTELDESKQSKIRCDGHIKDLEEHLLDKDVQIQSLIDVLQQDNSDSCCEDDCLDNMTLTEIIPQLKKQILNLKVCRMEEPKHKVLTCQIFHEEDAILMSRSHQRYVL